MKWTGRLPAGLRPRSRGQSMVEFALVLPILALLMFAVVDFGRAFFMYLSAASGARDGARYGTIYPGCNDPAGSTQASIQAKIRSSTDSAVEWARVTPVVTYFNAAATPSVVTTPVIPGLIEVQVVIPYEPITPLVGPIIGAPLMSAYSQMRIEQNYGCGSPTATPTATASPTPTNTPLPGSTPTPTPPPTPTAGPPTATPSPTPCAPPNAPTLNTANHGGGSHALSWSAPGSGPAPSTYNVYGDGSNPPTTLIASGVLGTSYTHSQGSHRNYAVAGVNPCGTGPKSNVING